MATEFKDEIIFNVKSSKPTSTPTERKSGGGYIRQEWVRRERKVSPEKFEQMRKMYEEVVVNDYGDEYHMSEDEKAKRFKHYEAFAKVTRCKRKFRKLDEFVKAYRICMDCLKIVAEDNGVYDPEVFMKRVLRGKITVYGLHFPRYIGKDKKEINWSYVTDFIEDRSLDPSQLTTQKQSDLSNLSREELGEWFFTKEELAELEKVLIDSQQDESVASYDEGKDSDSNNSMALTVSEKFTKEFVKNNPGIVKLVMEQLKEAKKSQRFNSHMSSFVFEMSQSDYEYIAKVDKERGYVSDSDIPEFKGDITNTEDYKRYLLALEIYEREHIKENYQGKMKTIGEIKEIELKNALEEAGWNLRNLYKSSREKKLKKAYKEDKKREEDLKRKLLSIQKRQKKRGKKSEVEFNSKRKKKKKNKKKKEDD